MALIEPYSANGSRFSDALMELVVRHGGEAAARLLHEAADARVYSRLDSFLLAAFAMAVAIHQRAAFEIANPDFECVVKGRDKGAAVLSPWLRILNAQAALIASLGDRLGLNPAARAALKLPHVKQRSKFEGLIGRAGLSLPGTSN